MRCRRNRGCITDDERACIHLGEAGVGIGSAQFEEATACFDQVAEGAGAAAIGDDTCQNRPCRGTRGRDRPSRALGSAGSVATEGDVPTENEISGPVVFQDRIPREGDVVGEGHWLKQTRDADAAIRAERAAVELNRASAQACRIAKFDSLSLIDEGRAREGVRRVQQDGAAAEGRSDGLSLHRIADRTKLHVVRSREDGAVQSESTAATADAIRAARANAECRTGVSGQCLIRNTTTEEHLTGSDGTKVQSLIVTSDINRDDAIIVRCGAAECNGGQGADILQVQDPEVGCVGSDRQSTRHIVRMRDTNRRAWINRDRARAEWCLNRAIQRNQGSLIHGHWLAVRGGVASDTEGHSSPLLQGSRTTKATEQIQRGGGVDAGWAIQGGRSKECHRIG